MNEQNIPISINAGKLLEWLINRRHCNKDWHTQVEIIREKINKAIQDMPAHDEISKFVSGVYINYFYSLKIIEILKETEADTKNVFGRYGSQRMKDWQEIIRLYEKDNVYLAESAQMLRRNINYEVPSIKKQIQKLEQAQIDFEKKVVEHKKSENMAHSEFRTLCKQLGIEGNKIKQELTRKVFELPEVYDRIAKKTKAVDKAVELYCAFVDYTLGRQHDGGCVPMVQYVMDKGNTTTYEWTYGEVPLSIVEPPLNIKIEEDEEVKPADDNVGIDFGDLDLKTDANLSGEVNLDDGGDIDWGDIAVVDAPGEEIDYNISLEESGIVVENTEIEGGKATGIEAYTILDNPSTRVEFINQLFELESFLKMRLYEFKNDNVNNLIRFSQMQHASSTMQLSTPESVQNMLDTVQVVLSDILDNKVQHLHNIKHSARYVDVLTLSLNQKLVLAERMVGLQNSMKQKRNDTIDKANELRSLLALVIDTTKELQVQIEQDISKKYKNRKVDLTGGITTLKV